MKHVSAWSIGCVAAALAGLLWPKRLDDRLAKFGGAELADGIWYFSKLLPAEVVAAVMANLPDNWAECLDSNGGRTCSKLAVGTEPRFQELLGTLGAVWGVEAATVTELPLMSFAPGQGGVSLHVDVQKEAHAHASSQDEPHEPADVTLLLYLTESDARHGGQTVFQHRNVSVSPSPGSLLAWTNVDRDGRITSQNAHFVTPYSLDAPTHRYVMQFGLQLRSHGGACPAPSRPWTRGLGFHPLKGGIDSERLLCGDHLGYTSITLGAAAQTPAESPSPPAEPPSPSCADCACARSRALGWAGTMRELLFGVFELSEECKACCA